MVRNYDNIKLEKLIKDYVFHGKEHSEIELSYQTIEGKDLVEILKGFKKTFDKDEKEGYLNDFLISLQEMIPLGKNLTPKETEEIHKKLWAEIYKYGIERGIFGEYSENEEAGIWDDLEESFKKQYKIEYDVKSEEQ